MADEPKIESGKTLWALIKSNLGTIIIIGGLVVNALMINGKKAVSSYKDEVLKADLIKKVSDVIDFQLRDSAHFYKWKAKEERKIDSLVKIFGTGMNTIRHISVSQDSLKEYMIRRAVTKQDMKEIYNIWNNDVEKKNFFPDSYLIPWGKTPLDPVIKSLSFR